MKTIDAVRSIPRHTAEPVVQPTYGSPALRKTLAVLRITVGWLFLWPFFDKLFGLGYATPSAHAWIHGGSPTKAFLAGVNIGPLQGFLHSFAGAGWADWLFMVGLLAIGLGLILGIGLRIVAVTGTILVVAMWFASWPLAKVAGGQPTGSTNPFIDDHLLFAVTFILFAVGNAGDTWGLGRWWVSLPVVRRNPWLR
jgi:thiosulfate dehydrogenase [quinone] large subunit